MSPGTKKEVLDKPQLVRGKRTGHTRIGHYRVALDSPLLFFFGRDDKLGGLNGRCDNFFSVSPHFFSWRLQNFRRRLTFLGDRAIPFIFLSFADS